MAVGEIVELTPVIVGNHGHDVPYAFHDLTQVHLFPSFNLTLVVVEVTVGGRMETTHHPHPLRPTKVETFSLDQNDPLVPLPSSAQLVATQDMPSITLSGSVSIPTALSPDVLVLVLHSILPCESMLQLLRVERLETITTQTQRRQQPQALESFSHDRFG